MHKPNKLNVVTTATFEEISKQIKHSIELVTQLSNSFKFSEPIRNDSLLDDHSVSDGIPSFKFCEPLERVNDGQNDTTQEELSKLFSSLNIFCSRPSIQLDCSKQRDVDNNAVCHNKNSSLPLDCSKQRMQRVVENDVVCHSDHSSLPIDSSKQRMQRDGDNDAVIHSDHSSIPLKCSMGSMQRDGENDVVSHSDNSSFPLDCSKQRDGDNHAFCHSDHSRIPLCCSKQRDVDNNVVCLNKNSSLPLECSMQRDGENDAVIHSDHSNIPLDCSKRRDVDRNKISNDWNDNIETDGHKSADLDPNTQITHLDVDSNEQNLPPQKYHDNQPQPFLVKHIHSITWPNQEKTIFVPVMQLFGQTFDAVMVYGMVTSLQIENGGLSLRFVIDDGSGSINVVWNANKHIIELIKNLHNLDEEVKSCRQSGLSVMSENWQPNSKECTEMLCSFNQTLHYIKREVTKRTKLKLFGNAAVVGKPIRPPGKAVTLYSSLIQDDSGADRSLELYCKKNLIRLYEEKYFVN